MTLNEMIQGASIKLKPCTPDFMIDAKNFASDLLDMDTTALFMAGNSTMSVDIVELYGKMINRRLLGEPFQYIVGHQSFMGLDFLVEPGVLIPRSDTEILVENVLSKLKGNENILDIGAGSGAIHCSLAYYNKSVHCTAVDISDVPLRVSKKNAKILKVDDRITFYKSDLYQALDNQTFDVIVSNPPYIKRDVVETLQVELGHEPKLALDGGEDGYDFYRKIITEGPRYLKARGLMALEVGHDQSKGVQSLLKEANFVNIEVIKDYNQIERVVIARYER